MKKCPEPERNVAQIFSAVKNAVMPWDAPERLCRGAYHEPSAIRIGPGRFAVVRDVLDVNGSAPGDTNIYFHVAARAAAACGIITTSEHKRLLDWLVTEEKAAALKRNLADLQQRAWHLGLEVVPIRKSKPEKKRRSPRRRFYEPQKSMTGVKRAKRKR